MRRPRVWVSGLVEDAYDGVVSKDVCWGSALAKLSPSFLRTVQMQKCKIVEERVVGGGW